MKATEKLRANELRIGNCVLVEGIECEVSGLDITDVTVNNHIAYDNEVFCLLGEGVNGIPLTEEWLLKFGFDNTIFDKDIWSITSMSNKIEYIYLEKTKSLQVADGYLITIAKNVKYVHTLQNLYFALTGEELTIK